MADTGFEGLVIQNLDSLSTDIKTIRINQELMQLDLNAIKVEQARQKQKQEELAGPLKQWTLDDSIALKQVIDERKLRTAETDRDDARSAKNTKRIQGWRDRLLLGTTVFTIFGLFRDQIASILRHLGL